MTRTTRLIGGLASATLVAGAAHAGGLDRSGQDISAIFETGTVAELSFGTLSPSVSGVFTHPVFGDLASGSVSPSYTVFSGAVKMDLDPHWSVALIVDQPWGAAIDYPAGTTYPLAGTSAHVDSLGITALGRYRVTDRIALHAGLRYIEASGDVTLSGVPYASSYSSGSDISYVVGASYEIPDIALRAALTYASATSYDLAGTVGDVAAKLPQSVNLDLQTGIAKDTLLFGQIRWADWSAARITDTLVGDLISYDSDVVTYSVGLGRKFTDSFSGAVTVGYEGPTNAPVSNLAPTDGYVSLGLGGTWTQGPVKITAGVAQYWLGDATTEAAGAFPGGSFKGNTAVGAGVKLVYSF